MKKIIITNKKNQTFEVLVDDEDFERVNQINWSIHENKKKYIKYAVYNTGIINISMHQFIMNSNYSLLINHKDQNGLNNQKQNLRFCNKSESNCRRPPRKNRLPSRFSKYTGVHKTYNNKYEANITKNKKRIYLGRFEYEIEAAKAYNEAAIKYHGEFANLNKI